MYHTVGKVPKSNRKILLKGVNLIPLIHISGVDISVKCVGLNANDDYRTFFQ